ncbi:carbohydrate sulfotransferase 11-like [Acanthaster planci]|uniref:Carbohydrate sulfotransferase n=1 Tax=Acanthaster planci TaxID=133434 RepID=A0A8B7YND6_ACAPL|nr:carbohydrate sulfotransferase 11-like [Acanthaster planci]
MCLALQVNIDEWLQEQDFQRRRVKSTCDTLRHQGIPDLHYNLTRDVLRKLDHLLVLDSHKLIYCYIPKVGCTGWKRIFLLLLGRFQKMEDISNNRAHYTKIPRLSQYSMKEAKRRLDEYTTIMFTREPLQRVISCYRDKFERESAENRLIQRAVFEKLRPYLNSTKSVAGRGTFTKVQFAEFVRYVSDPRSVFHSYDATEHWKEMYKMCHPCLLRYNYTGRFEHLTRDSDIILEETGLRKFVSFPKSTNPTNTSGQATLEKYMSQLQEADITALKHRYEIDTLFGSMS